MGQQVALVAPVNLRLRTRDDLEAAVQTAQRVLVPDSSSSAAIRGRASARNILTRW